MTTPELLKLIDDTLADSELDRWVYLRPSEWTDQQREHVQKCIVGPGVCAVHASGETANVESA